MFPLIQTVVRFLQRSPIDGARLPRNLFESAEARAGTNPGDARELRRAAQAALRVVR